MHIQLLLHKFSHVTNSKGPWRHVPSPGLTATFELHPLRGGADALLWTLAVSKDSQRLAVIHSGELNEQAIHDQVSFGDHPVPDTTRKVLVLEHDPYIALRHPLPDGQIRRIQLNFAATADFYRALDLFRSAGLPVRHKDISTKSATAQALNGHQTNTPAPTQDHSQLTLPHAADLQRYGARQTGTYPIFTSSQPSSWLNRVHSARSGPAIGPSLVESSSDRRFELPPRSHSQDIALPYHDVSRSSSLRAFGQSSSHHHYPSQVSRNLHTANSIGSDPVRRTLFSHGSQDSFERPTTAPITGETHESCIPPRRELPFATRFARTASLRTVEANKDMSSTEPSHWWPMAPKQSEPTQDTRVEKQKTAAVGNRKPSSKRKRQDVSRETACTSPHRESPGALAMLPSPLPASTSSALAAFVRPRLGLEKMALRTGTAAQIDTSNAISSTQESSISHISGTACASTAHKPIPITTICNESLQQTTIDANSMPTSTKGRRSRHPAPSRPQTRSQSVFMSQELNESREKVTSAKPPTKSQPSATNRTGEDLAQDESEARIESTSTVTESRKTKRPRTSAGRAAASSTSGSRRNRTRAPPKSTSMVTTQAESQQVSTGEETQTHSGAEAGTEETVSAEAATSIATTATTAPTSASRTEAVTGIQINKSTGTSTSAVPATLSAEETAGIVPATQAAETPSNVAPVKASAAPTRRARTAAPRRAKASVTSASVQTTGPTAVTTATTQTECSQHDASTLTAPASFLSPGELDVSADWLTTVEAFILHHQSRILSSNNTASNMRNTNGDMPSCAQPSSSQQDAASTTACASAQVSAAIHEVGQNPSLEQLVVACLLAPGFDKLCDDIGVVMARLGLDSVEDLGMQLAMDI